MGRGRRAVFVMAVALSLGGAADARAHTHLADLSPQPEAVLAHPPAAVRLIFNQPVDVVARATGMRSRGREEGVAIVRRAGGRLVLLRPRSALGAGRVDVRFRVLSRDGHVLRGRYGFKVRAGALPVAGVRSEALRVQDAGDTPAAVAHGLHHLLFVLALGLALTGPFVLGAAGLVFPLWGLRAICVGGVVMSVLGASLTWLSAEDLSPLRAVLPHSISQAASTSAGSAWLVRAELWFAAAVLAQWARLRLLALFGVAVSVAMSGHADSHGGAGSVIVDGVHLLAAGAWLGGLCVLGYAIARGGDRARATDAYARVALYAFAALLASGVLNAALRLGAWDRLVHGGYGTVVLAKAAIAACVAAVAAVGLRRRSAAGVSSLQLGAELTLGAAALTLAAILVETAPPT